MLSDAVWPALLRAVVTALLAAGAGILLRPALSMAGGPRKTLLWGLLLTPFLCPALVTGYAFLPVALRLMDHPVALELLYLTLLLSRNLAVAAVLIHFCPSLVTPEARHCYRLTHHRSLLFRIRGAGPAPWIAGTAVFLLAFNEFDLASMLGIRSWTVSLFDAQTGGLLLSATLHHALLPAAVSFAAVAVLIAFTASIREITPRPDRDDGFPATGCFFTVLLFLPGALFPLLAVGAGAVAGFPALFRNFVAGPDLLASLLFSATAPLAAFGLAGFLLRSRILTMISVIPGLTGSLPVSLAVLAIFQVPVLRPFYDSPLPLLLAFTICLLPLAVLLRILLRTASPAEGIHLAALLKNQRLLWELRDRRTVATLMLLFTWAYFDVTASAILAPLTMMPVFVRLHNLMHYGHSAVLSAMTLAALAVPVLLAAGALLVPGCLMRRRI